MAFWALLSITFELDEKTTDTDKGRKDSMKQVTLLLAFVATVWAHGYVDNATIGGEYYQV